MPRWDIDKMKPLAAIRTEAGYTMEKAALAAGMTSRTLGRYENGITDIPMRVAERLAELYRVSFEEIHQAVRETWLACTGKAGK